MIQPETAAAITFVVCGNLAGVVWAIAQRSASIAIVGAVGIACALMALK